MDTTALALKKQLDGEQTASLPVLIDRVVRIVNPVNGNEHDRRVASASHIRGRQIMLELERHILDFTESSGQAKRTILRIGRAHEPGKGTINILGCYNETTEHEVSYSFVR